MSMRWEELCLISDLFEFKPVTLKEINYFSVHNPFALLCLLDKPTESHAHFPLFSKPIKLLPSVCLLALLQILSLTQFS